MTLINCMIKYIVFHIFSVSIPYGLQDLCLQLFIGKAFSLHPEDDHLPWACYDPVTCTKMEVKVVLVQTSSTQVAG